MNGQGHFPVIRRGTLLRSNSVTKVVDTKGEDNLEYSYIRSP